MYKRQVQKFLNRSDILGGSTLGNISGTQVALNSVDIGLAQLSMHSPYETGGIKDTDYLIAAAKEFFRSSVVEIGSGEYRSLTSAPKSLSLIHIYSICIRMNPWTN